MNVDTNRGGYSSSHSLKVLELFGGIGACTQAFKKLRIDFTLVDYVEIDKWAVKSFNSINHTSFEPQDICEWDKDIDIDFIMHGSPCQDFSVCGSQAGGDKNSGTRSSLMYETVRIVDKLKPKYVVWENVKNILSKNHKHNFDNYINTLEGIGYNSYYKVLNAKDYGIPQHRERVYTISIRKDIDDGSFEFPEPIGCDITLKDLLEDNVDKKYYFKNEQISKGYLGNALNPNLKDIYNRSEMFINKSIAYTLSTKPDRRIGDCNYVTTDKEQIKVKDWIKYNYNPNKPNDKTNLRKLTPRECYRLMGFDDESFDKAQSVCHNTNLYKQAGNSIVVNVLMYIFDILLK